MNNKKVGYLSYNENNNRYGVKDATQWLDSGLHCGETIELYIDGSWTVDRIEYDAGEWFFVYSRLKGQDLDGLKARV